MTRGAGMSLCTVNLKTTKEITLIDYNIILSYSDRQK
jgi:hypothetical protein